MITLRPAAERGHVDYGWLDTRHTFSFGDYHDPEHRGFRVLRVINEDRVEPGAGFPTHGHWNMEIVTVVLEGALQHADSMGNGSVIRAGEVQRMTAGTGVTHSEHNPSEEEAVHFLQIWILPREKGLAPGYEQRAIDRAATRDALHPIASPDGREGSLTIAQDAVVLLGELSTGARVEHAIAPGRAVWIHVADGEVTLDGRPLATGDGAAVSDQERLVLEATAAARVLVFDLP